MKGRFSGIMCFESEWLIIFRGLIFPGARLSFAVQAGKSRSGEAERVSHRHIGALLTEDRVKGCVGRCLPTVLPGCADAWVLRSAWKAVKSGKW